MKMVTLHYKQTRRASPSLSLTTQFRLVTWGRTEIRGVAEEVVGGGTYHCSG